MKTIVESSMILVFTFVLCSTLMASVFSNDHHRADNATLLGPKGLSRRTVTSAVPIRRCSQDNFETCLEMMQEVMENSSLASPTNAQELDITCRKLKSGDYCAEKYIRSCAGNQQRVIYQDIVQGTKNMIRHLCQQGETQQLYLKYAACFKDISMSEEKCALVLNRFQETSKGLATGTDDESLLQFCCAYRDSVHCQVENVRQYCGPQGLKFFERYMGEMTNSLINEHCVGYTYSDKCRPYLGREVGEFDGQVAHDLSSNTESNHASQLYTSLAIVVVLITLHLM